VWRKLLFGLLVLPGNVLVVVPALIVWAASGTAFAARPAGAAEAPLWVGLPIGAAGLVLMAWTVRDFVRVGLGTPAPWAPPEKLVLTGPYRHVRNPMISGALAALAAEAMVLRCWPVGAWFAAFALANFFYIPLFEEPGLERRFGDDYRRYRENVPRWIPRFTPWRGADGE
jgi:protein-S-isoprenylcysteine O-methyltransferase Ste14